MVPAHDARRTRPTVYFKNALLLDGTGREPQTGGLLVKDEHGRERVYDLCEPPSAPHYRAPTPGRRPPGPPSWPSLFAASPSGRPPSSLPGSPAHRDPDVRYAHVAVCEALRRGGFWSVW